MLEMAFAGVSIRLTQGIFYWEINIMAVFTVSPAWHVMVVRVHHFPQHNGEEANLVEATV